MTGFVHNVLGGIGHFFDKEYHQALTILQPSIDAVAAVIKSQGAQDVEKIVAAMATAAAGALSGGASAAGQAALAAAGATAVAEATDALHAIATATVTAAKASAQ